MIYGIKELSDSKIGRSYEQCMDELSGFYGIEMKRNRPRVIVVDSRKLIDSLKQAETDSWLVGWAEGRSIFILNQSKTGEESRDKYDDERYYMLIKHELSHNFMRSIVGSGYVPAWLNEGVALYSAGQNKLVKPVVKFNGFLEFYDKTGRKIYGESGLAVEALVKRHGKRKLLRFIRKLRSVKNKTGFIKEFRNAFGSNPSYAYFNDLIK